MSDQLHCVVIGAGVIGLAIARRFALSGIQVVVLEAEEKTGVHTSSRNSEVIHAGIHYPEDSLKARLCIEGKNKLYQYCAERKIPVSRLGKLIVGSSSSDEQALRQIELMAITNGVADLQWLTKAQIASLEPYVLASLALRSPSTGIVDSHALVQSLHADLENCGGTVACRNRVSGMTVEEDGFLISTEDTGKFSARCKILINAAGLWANKVARKINGHDPHHIPRQYLAKGHYYTYRGPSPFSHLIYPVPTDGGLGIHVTQDISGATRFGPDVTWVDDIDYRFEEGSKAKFVTAIRRYFPDLDSSKLQPGYTGIRPKLVARGVEPVDFQIYGPEIHGIPGLVNLFGIESPGLTASLAIADFVYAKVLGET